MPTFNQPFKPSVTFLHSITTTRLG
jgi:hypothetical protein